LSKTWTFGRRIGVGFAVTVALTLVIGAVAVYALRGVVESKDQVISFHAQNIRDAERLGVAAARRASAVRGYFLSKQGRHLEELTERRESFRVILTDLRERISDAEGRGLLEDIDKKEAEYRTASERVIAQRQGDAALDAVVAAFDQDVAPRRDIMTQAIDAFIVYGERVLEREKRLATSVADSAVSVVLVFALIIIALATTIAIVLTRTLGHQIGTAVAQVQSSSAELQAAASQQATAMREQATAMNEITTTITELLSTSRQIADSAQRVANVAAETVSSATTGDATVGKAHQALVAIKSQVDRVVSHMLELGTKSQQIGTVLDIVAELAEQTNILAINAAIEAAGAGDAGKRFAVVADEIRKLADRVSGSTKEIRGLIDDIRSSINSTVMTTEAGSKAVDAGTKQFSELASAFKQIAGLIGTTKDAAREIELSTKQQTTAVEQINVAVGGVAQAAVETQASAGQTLQTAGQLNALSSDLLRLVQPQTVAPAAVHLGLVG
jgi:methyl-accepting chemotaxis protein